LVSLLLPCDLHHTLVTEYVAAPHEATALAAVGLDPCVPFLGGEVATFVQSTKGSGLNLPLHLVCHSTLGFDCHDQPFLVKKN
jgi:hypothetical protein